MYPFNPNSAYEPAFQGDETVRIAAMDVYVKGNKIYWTNWHTGRISCRELPSSAGSSASNRNRRQIDGGVTHLNVSSRNSSMCRETRAWNQDLLLIQKLEELLQHISFSVFFLRSQD